MKRFSCRLKSRHFLGAMMLNSVVSILLVFGATSPVYSQNTGGLPYYEIPNYPEKYTAGTVAARLVDGLGFRFYWATEGLREQDLSFKPSDEARSLLETIQHIYDLSKVVVNATTKTSNKQTDVQNLSYEELRKLTLLNIEKAADILRNCKDEDFEDFKLIFEGSDNTSEYPFWNNLNGPIADALWHCGQVVSLRRTAGNPFNSNVSVFNGRVRN